MHFENMCTLEVNLNTAAKASWHLAVTEVPHVAATVVLDCRTSGAVFSLLRRAYLTSWSPVTCK
jgi:hypothetical protein